MNGKKAKKIRKMSVKFVIEWLQSMLIDEEKKKLSIKNYKKYLPQDTHFYANGKWMVSAYTPRWYAKRIKKLLKYKELNDITWSDIESLGK